MDGIARDTYRLQHTERTWDRQQRVNKENGGRILRDSKSHQENNQFLASILLEKTSREKTSQPIHPGERLKRGNHEKTFALSPVLCSSFCHKFAPTIQWDNSPVPKEILH